MVGNVVFGKGVVVGMPPNKKACADKTRVVLCGLGWAVAGAGAYAQSKLVPIEVNQGSVVVAPNVVVAPKNEGRVVAKNGEGVVVIVASG